MKQGIIEQIGKPVVLVRKLYITMAFTYKNSKGKTYYLNQREAAGKGRGKLFFFSGEKGNDSVDNMPEGYTIVENSRTGLPVLKKK
ncbi:MAG TPA: hypothetical protein VIK89_07570 [Cytophagaceae bacterium]